MAFDFSENSSCHGSYVYTEKVYGARGVRASVFVRAPMQNRTISLLQAKNYGAIIAYYVYLTLYRTRPFYFVRKLYRVDKLDSGEDELEANSRYNGSAFKFRKSNCT